MAPAEKPSEALHVSSVINDKFPISKLHVDRSYQRVPRMALVDQLVRDWDIIAAELILVSDRGAREPVADGGHFIVSGQHRVRAAQKKGLKVIPARVIDMTKVDNPAPLEAYYRRLANFRAQDSTMDAFKAKVIEGDPTATAIVKLLAKHKTEVNVANPDPSKGINAVATLEELYDKDEGSVLDETLTLLREVYGEVNPIMASTTMLRAVAWLLDSHSQDIVRNRLVERMQSLTLSQLRSRAIQMQALMGKSRWLSTYCVLLEMYNDKLSNKNQLTATFRGATVRKDKYGNLVHRADNVNMKSR